LHNAPRFAARFATTGDAFFAPHSLNLFLKNMNKIALSLIVSAFPLLALAQVPVAIPKGDAVVGKGKAVAICSGCHGVPGIRTAYPEVYNVPRLGGQNADYLVTALRAYRAGDRYNQTMKALASALTEKEILDIAAYYGQK
jgi:cytochrome c553